MGFLDALMGGGQQVQQPGQAFQDPMQGMGLLGRLQYMQQNNPQALMALGSGMMQGNMGAGFAAAGDQMAQHRERLMEQQAQQQQMTQTQRWLMQNRGLSQEEAEMATSNPQILGTYLKGGQGQGYINAGGGNLFNSETGEWVSAPGGGSEGVAGLVPVWLKDENGNPVLGQMTKDGKVIRSEIDEGLSPVGPYEKGFETHKGQAEGKAVGEAAGALPGATTMASKIAEQVESLKNDPYLPNMLGPLNSRLPNITQDAARVQAKINQIQGGAFLQARQMLKGGGAITDYEGVKAEEAFARLNQAQSEEDFKAALDEFNFYVQQGLAKLEAQAGQSRIGAGTVPPPPGGGTRLRFNPATGELE